MNINTETIECLKLNYGDIEKLIKECFSISMIETDLSDQNIGCSCFLLYNIQKEITKDELEEVEEIIEQIRQDRDFQVYNTEVVLKALASRNFLPSVPYVLVKYEY